MTSDREWPGRSDLQISPLEEANGIIGLIPAKGSWLPPDLGCHKNEI